MSNPTWRVECDDGKVRSVGVGAVMRHLCVAAEATHSAYITACIAHGTSERAAVCALAVALGWPVVAILAPGQLTRAEVEADAFRRGAEAMRAAAKRVCDDVEASAEHSSEADVALRCGARIDALTMAEVTR